MRRYATAVAPRFIRRKQLEPHLDRHQLKDLYLEGELKKLQFAMARMR